jgi:hypothetical protein
MDDELLADIALILMSETVTAGYGMNDRAREALKRIMLKMNVTTVFARTSSVQEAIEIRLRELLCLPPAA